MVVINVDQEEAPENIQLGAEFEDDDDTLVLRGRERRPLISSDSRSNPVTEPSDTAVNGQRIYQFKSEAVGNEHQFSPVSGLLSSRFQIRGENDVTGEGRDPAYPEQ